MSNTYRQERNPEIQLGISLRVRVETMSCVSERRHEDFFDTHIRIKPPFTTAMVKDRARKKEENDTQADKNNRPVQEHSTRSKMLEI